MDQPHEGPFQRVAERVVTELAWAAPHLSWVVAAHEENLWVPVALVDPTYAPLLEIPIPWHHTHGARMVRGEGPRVAPRTDEVPAYTDAPTNRELTVRAFIGAPVQLPDGRSPAVVCGWTNTPQDDALRDLLPLVERKAAELEPVLPDPIWLF